MPVLQRVALNLPLGIPSAHIPGKPQMELSATIRVWGGYSVSQCRIGPAAYVTNAVFPESAVVSVIPLQVGTWVQIPSGHTSGALEPNNYERHGGLDTRLDGELKLMSISLLRLPAVFILVLVGYGGIAGRRQISMTG